MENRQPTFTELLLEAHIGLERQGPGSRGVIKQALKFLEPLDRFRNTADLGCGTGGQTLYLAEHLAGTITGLDMFPDFIEKLNQKAKAIGFENRVKGMVGKMEALPFAEKSLDLIWSEGAIDNIGFENGIGYWRGFLKQGGYLAVSCPSWLTKEHPVAVEKFWSDAGSHLDPVNKNIEIMENCGYAFVSAFVLPEECWTEQYFDPRKQAIEKLTEKYENCDTVQKYAELNQTEVELFRQYKQHYGYVFYIGKTL